MVRYFGIFLFLLTLISACSQNRKGISNTVNQKSYSVNINQDETKGPAIVFETIFKDLGEVVQTSHLVYEYEFTNTGNEPLIITNVRTSCSCTVASYPQIPILSGESDNVVIKLDTKILGQFNKTVAVYSNALNHFADDISQSRVILKVKWIVVEDTLENSDN